MWLYESQITLMGPRTVSRLFGLPLLYHSTMEMLFLKRIIDGFGIIHIQSCSTQRSGQKRGIFWPYFLRSTSQAGERAVSCLDL